MMARGRTARNLSGIGQALPSGGMWCCAKTWNRCCPSCWPRPPPHPLPQPHRPQPHRRICRQWPRHRHQRPRHLQHRRPPLRRPQHRQPHPHHRRQRPHLPRRRYPSRRQHPHRHLRPARRHRRKTPRQPATRKSVSNSWLSLRNPMGADAVLHTETSWTVKPRHKGTSSAFHAFISRNYAGNASYCRFPTFFVLAIVCCYILYHTVFPTMRSAGRTIDKTRNKEQAHATRFCWWTRPQHAAHPDEVVAT